MAPARPAKPAATSTLAEYRAKRDFSKTFEPSGETPVTPSARPRFVIQRHAAGRLHYDFRLELDGVFKSWAVAKGPSLDPADKRLAVETEDHPLDYGDFEGTIPKGQYGGGAVQMWDRGYWEAEGAKTAQDGLKAGDFKFQLHGKRLRGSWVLVRLKRRDGEKRDSWLLIKHRDAYARPGDADALLAEDKSIASGRSMAEIAAGKGRRPKPFMLGAPTKADAVWHSNRPSETQKAPAPSAGKPVAKMPDFVAPQFCRLVAKPPDGPGWAHEIKLDGYRAQLRVEGGRAVVRTRTGLDWTDKFTALATAGAKLDDCLLDGEIVALDKAGAPDFPALQKAISDGKTDKLVYFAFDCLFAGGFDLRGLPLRARKEALTRLLDGAPTTRLRLVGHLEQPGNAVFQAARQMALEGIVSKKLSAPYQSGRTDSWLKLKTRPGQEVVIGGWSEENGRFRSLLAGAYDKGRLVYIGRVGTGFGDDAVKRLAPQLRAVAAATSPFSGPNAPAKAADIRWAAPSLVAEVEFAGWSADGLLRQAAFKGLRADKAATAVRREAAPPAAAAAQAPRTVISSSVRKPENAPVRGVALSHGDRVLWPATAESAAVTKRDLALYYDAIGDWLLAHLKGRPCSIVRAPDGLAGQTFFQRHAVQGSSDLFTLVEVSGDKKPYVQFDTVEALVAAAQVATVELHPWNCQPGAPETPGRLVFDFDPAPDLPFEQVIAAAREMKDRLAALGLESFCKTTGGKGLHVVTPFRNAPRSDLKWPEAKAFAQEVCRRMAADSPDRYLISMSKKDRVGRIFLDYLRNDRTATAVASLSPRARAGAPVSMPVTWAQVRKGLDPQRFTLHSAPALIARSKAWADYSDGARPFAAAARKLYARQ